MTCSAPDVNILVPLSDATSADVTEPPMLVVSWANGQVEGYEIFIKFLPPSANAETLKAFFSEARTHNKKSRYLLDHCLQDQSNFLNVCIPLCLVTDIELCAAVLSAWVGWPNRNLPVNRLQVACAGYNVHITHIVQVKDSAAKQYAEMIRAPPASVVS